MENIIPSEKFKKSQFLSEFSGTIVALDSNLNNKISFSFSLFVLQCKDVQE